jgi:hypothetical protein
MTTAMRSSTRVNPALFLQLLSFSLPII